MESIFLSILNASTKDIPTIVSVITTLTTAIIFVWYQLRKGSNESLSVEADTHQKQIDSLMKQINVLSNELTQARKQLAELHETNLQLMEQLRKANLRISELEIILASYEFRNNYRDFVASRLPNNRGEFIGETETSESRGKRTPREES